MADILQLADMPKSRYVVEVRFDGTFSVNKSNGTLVTLWERTPKGLRLVYKCPYCDEMIDHIQLGGPSQRIVCAGCFGATTGRELVEGRFYRLGVARFARQLAGLLRGVALDADVYLIRLKSRLSLQAADEVARVRPGYGEVLLDRARSDEKAVYTKGALERDLGSGSDLEERLKAFLLA